MRNVSESLPGLPFALTVALALTLGLALPVGYAQAAPPAGAHAAGLHAAGSQETGSYATSASESKSKMESESKAEPVAARHRERPVQPTYPVPPTLKGTVTFACGQGKEGAKSLFATTLYAADTAGWDLGTAPKVDNGTCSSATPFFFSIPLPEGNYRVKILFGGPAKSVDTVRAEARRLMLEKVPVKANGLVEREFDVNVRVPEFKNPDGTPNRVHLKPREFHNLDWDNKLTIEFNGVNPSFHAFSITPLVGSHRDTVIYLAGDSTVVDQDVEPWASWGQMLPRFFHPGVVIANNAESGETSASFIGEQRFAKILSVIKTGDFFFMQFNQNDQKPGAVSLERYSQIFTQFVRQVRAKGGIPVIVTAMNRMTFDASGHITNSLGAYPAAARKVAADNHVPLIDLTAMSKTMFDAMGPDIAVHAFMHYPAHTFPGQTKAYADNTHFNSYGAYELARCVVHGIRKNRLSIAGFLDRSVPDFNPAKFDPYDTFSLPPTPIQTKEVVTKLTQN